MIDLRRSLGNTESLYDMAVAMNATHLWQRPQTPPPIRTSLGELAFVYASAWQARARPNICVWRGGTLTVVCVAGIYGADDAMAVYQGWLDPVVMQGHQGLINEFARRWYDNSGEAWDSFNVPGQAGFIFVGHSWGSSLATLWAQRMVRFSRQRRVDLVTFGAPRFANSGFLAEISVNQFHRVMNRADLVPRLCPYPLESPFFYGLHSIPDQVSLSQYTHMRGGVEIYRTGITNTEEVTGNTLPLELNLPRIRQEMIVAGGPHSPADYIQVLDLINQVDNPRLHNSVVDAPTTRPVSAPVLTIAMANRIHDAAARARQSGQVPAVPVVPSGIERRPRIRAVRRRSQWVVLIEGETVYLATGRSDARAYARALRAASTQMSQNPGGLVDPDALVARLLGNVPFADPIS